MACAENRVAGLESDTSAFHMRFTTMSKAVLLLSIVVEDGHGSNV
jgi:hypothetical protein